MEPLWSWGIDFILKLQQGHPNWTTFVKGLTFLGGEDFPLVILPLVYWCIHIDLGIRFAILLMLNFVTNLQLKALFNLPRPFQYDSRVLGLSESNTPGFPSGHTQTATVMWFTLSRWINKTWGWGVASLLVIGIALSRLYLGVHFPGDVIGGFLTGIVLIGLFTILEAPLSKWLSQQATGTLIAGSGILGLVLCLIQPTETGITAGAALGGAGMGIVVARRWIKFQLSDSWKHRGLSYLVGMIGVILSWAGLKVIFEALTSETSTVGLILRGIRYTTVALWVTGGAPWLFVQLQLATRETEKR